MGVIILSMKLIVLAAGRGTRFLPITEDIPKALIPVLDKPLVQYTLDLCVPYVSGIIFVVNNILGAKIKEYFGENYKGLPVTYVFQDLEVSNGTLGALHQAKDFIDEDRFVVCNSDDLYIEEDIRKAFSQTECGAGLSMGEMPYYYHGIEVFNGYIKGFQKHSESDKLVRDNFINGFYILNKKVFSFEPILIKNGEMGLPHTLFANLDKLPLKAIQFSDWVAVDSLDNITKAENFIKKYYFKT